MKTILSLRTRIDISIVERWGYHCSLRICIQLRRYQISTLKILLMAKQGSWNVLLAHKDRNINCRVMRISLFASHLCSVEKIFLDTQGFIYHFLAHKEGIIACQLLMTPTVRFASVFSLEDIRYQRWRYVRDSIIELPFGNNCINHSEINHEGRHDDCGSPPQPYDVCRCCLLYQPIVLPAVDTPHPSIILMEKMEVWPTSWILFWRIITFAYISDDIP